MSQEAFKWQFGKLATEAGRMLSRSQSLQGQLREWAKEFGDDADEVIIAAFVDLRRPSSVANGWPTMWEMRAAFGRARRVAQAAGQAGAPAEKRSDGPSLRARVAAVYLRENGGGLSLAERERLYDSIIADASLTDDLCRRYLDGERADKPLPEPVAAVG